MRSSRSRSPRSPEGGPGLLATLVVVSSLFQFLFAARLSFLRRVVTPMVAGIVIMLISVTVTPIAFDMLDDEFRRDPPRPPRQ